MASKSKQFGEWLYNARKRSGLTQQELADKAGCSKSYVSTLERASGHSITGADLRPSEEVVTSFAKALGVPCSEALRQAGYLPETTYSEENLSSEDVEKMLRWYNALPPEGKKLSLAQFEALYKHYMKIADEQADEEEPL